MPRQEQRGFKYQKRSREDVKERANMKGGNYDTIFKSKYKTWKPKEGKNIIRILPPTWKGAKHYGLDIFVNYSIGPDKNSYLSLSKHNQGDDPLAEARREAEREGDKKYAQALRPSQRILYWIIDRQDEEEGPQLWAAPFTFDKNVANMCVDEDTKEVIEVDSPTEGRDIRFYREGTNLNTDYPAAKMKFLSKSSIHEDEGQEEEWLEYIQENQLPDVLNFYSYEHIKAQFDGMAGRDDEDEDEDEKPRRGSKVRSKKDDDEDEKPARRRAKVADDDEDEDEKPSRTRQRAKPADDDDDEDEDEKPRRRTTSRKPEPEDDDPDDEEDEKPSRSKRRVAEPDDEEDEKPAKRTRQRVKPDPDEDEDEDDDGDEDERPTKGRRRGNDDDDEDEKPSSRRSNLREKLAARRKRGSDDD